MNKADREGLYVGIDRLNKSFKLISKCNNFTNITIGCSMEIVSNKYSMN